MISHSDYWKNWAENFFGHDLRIQRGIQHDRWLDEPVKNKNKNKKSKKEHIRRTDQRKRVKDGIKACVFFLLGVLQCWD